jgi:crotonobetainyl-CoA:carnitine CoA-transferase CaiB-like acyl-CoA transferase
MLEGYKVVEMATYIAGPGAAGMMADWGAEVIKVEAPGGDPIRWNRPPGREGGSSPNFELDNRGKRSIAVDYRRPEGCEVIRRLAAWADVFITSARPKALARAGLDYPALAAVNPGIVYASVTGYGLAAPWPISAPST